MNEQEPTQAFKTIEACHIALVRLQAIMDEALEFVSYCDRKNASRRQVAILALSTRQLLQNARTTIAECGIEICRLNGVALDAMNAEMLLQATGETGSESGSTSGPTSFLEAENP